jgi:ribosomal protein S18 acetylase RimI-like enzyme
MVEIREFLPTEIADYCKIRLRALEENPEAFLTTAQGFRNRPKSEHLARLQRNYDSPNECMLGAFDGVEPVGMMGVIRAGSEKMQHIAGVVAVFVAPEYRGQNIGGRLLDAAIAYARTMEGLEQLRLGVVTTNESAIQLYLSRGFEIYGTEINALKSGDRYWDEHLMWLRLN